MKGLIQWGFNSKSPVGFCEAWDIFVGIDHNHWWPHSLNRVDLYDEDDHDLYDDGDDDDAADDGSDDDDDLEKNQNHWWSHSLKHD